jgi:hypothetical protein
MFHFFSRCFLLLSCMHVTYVAAARIFPHSGAVLSQVQVMFEYDEIGGADYYQVIINPDYALAGATPMVRIKNTSLAVPVNSGLRFGNQYKWYYEAYSKTGKMVYRSGEIFFSIKSSPLTDTNLYRTKVTIAKPGFRNDILMLDNIAAAIDRKGSIVWFLPSQSDSIRGPFRNVQLTRDGTVTYLDNSDCFELSLTGDLVWKAPNDGRVSGDKQEFYHHDFAKLRNGNYLCAGYQFVNEKNYYDNSVDCKVRYNTLIHYNLAGDILWQWNEKDHTTAAAIFKEVAANAGNNEGTHMNGFSYDYLSDGIVVSCRNNSSVFKIDYKTGKVLYDLAESLNGNNKALPYPYNSQHGPFVMPNGNIIIYNNNSIGKERISWPGVQIFQQPKGAQPAKKIWEYECRSAAFPNGIRAKEGYASSLPDNNLLVCMGGANFAFEITPAKKLLWECFFEKLERPLEGEPSWKGYSNYRMQSMSSLYPRYFTLQQLTRSWQSLGAKNPSFKMQINNEGSDADTYKAVLTDAIGRELAAQTITVAPRKKAVLSFAFSLNKETAVKQNDRYGMVTVYPIENPAIKKELGVVLY